MKTQVPIQYSHTIGFLATMRGRGFTNPVDMAFDSDGVMYVVNRVGPEDGTYTPYKRITICTASEEYVGEFGTGGEKDGQLMWPSSIAIDKDDNIYISDEALHRISIFNKNGDFLGKWGLHGSKDGEFDRPSGISFDREGNLLVADGLNSRIQRYTKDGVYLSQWGREGDGKGEFNIPWGVTIDLAGNVYVADWRNDRIQKFDSDGQFLATWGSSGQGDGEFRRPSGVGVDPDGMVYVADWGNERVQIFDPSGSFVGKLRGQAQVSKWGMDYFTTNLDELQERENANLEPELFLLPTDEHFREESASIEKLFWGPIAIKIDRSGSIYVVESCRHRIQVYRKGP